MDHDRQTGAFRAWICRPCNQGIGQLQDSLAGVLMAAAYLARVQDAVQ